MSRRRALLVVACVAMLALAGCTGGGGNGAATPGSTTSPSTDTTTSTPGETTLEPVDVAATEVREQALDATGNVTAYRVDVNGTVTVSANNVVQQIGVEQTAAVNRTTGRFQQTLEQSVRGRTVAVESYFVDGLLYAKSQANVQRYGAEWTKNALDDSALLERGDLLQRQEHYLTNATLTVEGATTVAGTPVYQLRADVNGSVFGSSLPLLDQVGNVTTDDVTATYFVGRDDGRLHRLQLGANLTVDTGQVSQELALLQTVDLTYEPVSVTLPEAADSAVNITDESAGTDESGSDTENSDGSSGDNSDDGNNTSDGTDESAGIDVRDGALAVDPDRTFQRVEQVLVTDVTDPESVVVQGPANLTNGGDEPDRRTLASVLGLESVSLAGTNVTFGAESVPLAWLAEGRVDGVGNVYLHNAPEMPTDVARILTTHEFVHYVQLQNGRFSAVNAVTDATTDGTYAGQATTEGAAVFTTDTLLARDVPEGPRNVELYDGIAAAVPNGSANAWRNSWYRYGNRYVDARIDDPANLSRVYANPPTTSEQVLHRLAPGNEPPTPLTVDIETGSEYVAAGSDRKGEAYTRHVLANGVETERAVTAAAGWGNDTVRSFRPADGDGTTSYVWIHRWDDAANASEFADAAQDYLDDYGTVENGTTTLDGVPVSFEQLGDRTTAFVIGAPAFQDAVTVERDGETVVVEAS